MIYTTNNFLPQTEEDITKRKIKNLTKENEQLRKENRQLKKENRELTFRFVKVMFNG